MTTYDKIPDGWMHLTRGVQSPKGADWIYNGEPFFKDGKPNLERKTGLLITSKVNYGENNNDDRRT